VFPLFLSCLGTFRTAEVLKKGEKSFTLTGYILKHSTYNGLLYDSPAIIFRWGHKRGETGVKLFVPGIMVTYCHNILNTRFFLLSLQTGIGYAFPYYVFFELNPIVGKRVNKNISLYASGKIILGPVPSKFPLYSAGLNIGSEFSFSENRNFLFYLESFLGETIDITPGAELIYNMSPEYIFVFGMGTGVGIRF